MAERGEGRKDKEQNKMTKINAKLVLISSQITTDPSGDAEQPTQSKKSKSREQRWRSGRAQHSNLPFETANVGLTPALDTLTPECVRVCVHCIFLVFERFLAPCFVELLMFYC